MDGGRPRNPTLCYRLRAFPVTSLALLPKSKMAKWEIVEQSYKTAKDEIASDALPSEVASRRVSRGIMRALELNQLAPGQRLVETSLAAEYRVGRNAVREAVQWLAAHGVIDVSRHRSASLRHLDAAETLDVLEIAEAVIGLLVKAAARNYKGGPHEKRLAAGLAEAVQANDERSFARARRHLYGILLEIGGNRELQRLFPAVGLHILLAQYRTAMPKRQCLDDFRAMAVAITHKDVEHAHALGRAHIGQIRRAILGQDGN
jgi:DNA-binding GntR family transcriptional regulator